jgi:hypothetical protein
VTLPITYLGRLGCIGPYQGTLKRSWVPWWLPPGVRTQSEGETLDLLLATQFPDSDVVEGAGYLLLPTVPHAWTGW